MLDLTKETFDAAVLQARGLVAVDWWSPKCEACVEMLPDLERLERIYGDRVRFTKVNVLENRRLAISHRVLGLPAFLLFREGERVAALSGPDDCTPEAVEAVLKRLV